MRNILQGESQVLTSVEQENRSTYCVSTCTAHCLSHGMSQCKIDSVWLGRFLQGPSGQNKARAILGPECWVQVELSSKSSLEKSPTTPEVHLEEPWLGQAPICLKGLLTDLASPMGTRTSFIFTSCPKTYISDMKDNPIPIRCLIHLFPRHSR